MNELSSSEFSHPGKVITCVLVDDEKDNLELLEYMLQESGFPIKILYCFQDSREALKVLSQIRPDILFLDIQMPGLTGFQLLEQLGTWDFQVVFSTAYDQYAIQALKLSAFDYLLKPLNQQELNQVLSKFKNKLLEDDKKLMQLSLQKLTSFIKPKVQKKLLPGSNDLIYLDVENVIYFEADGVITWAKQKNGPKICINLQMKELENELHDTEFFRIHRSFCINLNEITKISRKEGVLVIMSNNDQIPVSRAKKSEFFNKIQHG